MEKKESRTERQVTVKNKDIILLSRVLYAMQDVSATEQKRLWQQERLWNITQKLTGMPKGRGETGGIDRSFAAIGEIEERYERECEAYVRELKRAEDILNAISSPTMRTFVTMRYVLGMGNKEIMTRLNLKRYRYESLCRLIEDAPDMEAASEKWKESGERFTLQLLNCD